MVEDPVLGFIQDFWDRGVSVEGYIVLSIIRDDRVWLHFTRGMSDRAMKAIWELANKYDLSINVRGGSDKWEVIVEVCVKGRKERDGRE